MKDIAKIKLQLQSIRAKGGTSIYKGLSTAVGILNKSTAEKRFPNGKKCI